MKQHELLARLALLKSMLKNKKNELKNPIPRTPIRKEIREIEAVIQTVSAELYLSNAKLLCNVQSV